MEDELAEVEAPIGAIAVPKLPPPGFCLWPCGEPGELEFRWCGVKVARPGQPYCRKHVAATREQWAGRRRPR
jgi:hypothetical protein